MKIKQMELFYEKGEPYLHIIGIEITSDGKILSIDIPRLRFPQQFYSGNLTIKTVGDGIKNHSEKILTSGDFKILPVLNHDNQPILYTIKIEKRITTILKQIEKEFGYPIKIVGEKNENN